MDQLGLGWQQLSVTKRLPKWVKKVSRLLEKFAKV